MHFLKNMLKVKSTIYYSINCDLETDLKGIYQKENKNTAVTAIKILKNKMEYQ